MFSNPKGLKTCLGSRQVLHVIHDSCFNTCWMLNIWFHSINIPFHCRPMLALMQDLQIIAHLIWRKKSLMLPRWTSLRNIFFLIRCTQMYSVVFTWISRQMCRNFNWRAPVITLLLNRDLFSEKCLLVCATIRHFQGQLNLWEMSPHVCCYQVPIRVLFQFCSRLPETNKSDKWPIVCWP